MKDNENIYFVKEIAETIGLEPAIILAALTIFINFGMHDFWNEYPNTDAGREMQNFVKNLGIFAGLLVLSASHNINQWRLFKNS